MLLLTYAPTYETMMLELRSNVKVNTGERKPGSIANVNSATVANVKRKDTSNV